MRSVGCRFFLLAIALGFSSSAPAEQIHLDAAREVARWIGSVGTRTDGGRVWPVEPAKPDKVVTTLYSGTSGVVLFFLEAYHSTHEADYLEQAREGADYLLATLPEQLTGDESGLYTGIAGIGFTLVETYKATNDMKYRKGALRTVKLLQDAAQDKGKGITWNDTTDIISGSSGTGLFLLYIGRELDHPPARELAIRAGYYLLEQGEKAEKGTKWPMSPNYPRLMPNFSHGTAGVAYYLVNLFNSTKEEAFFQAATAGATYLKSIADTTGNTCLIFHHEAEGEDLHYLGWCHGPPGTARLFYVLFNLTGDDEWMNWLSMSARAVLTSGIPEKKTEGFWNNHGQCCGTAGVAEFMLSLHRFTENPEYLDFVRQATRHVLDQRTHDEKGIRWLHAEHRTKPDLLQVQTGYMQGAAGIGMLLLRLHAFDEGKTPQITFPDSPF